MKAVLLATLALVAMSSAATAGRSRGCIYILGNCDRECDEGTHAYAISCGYKTPEPTCEDPEPVQEEYPICDYSACYCDAPTVRDAKTNKCVTLDQCSK